MRSGHLEATKLLFSLSNYITLSIQNHLHLALSLLFFVFTLTLRACDRAFSIIIAKL